MRILVTGANGFLGREIVRQAAEAGLSVRATDRQAACVQPGIEYAPADILEPESLVPLVRGISCVVHAAGLTPAAAGRKTEAASFTAVNATGTANVARAAAGAGVASFVLISSVSVYGSSGALIRNETHPCRPRGAYAESKLQSEERAREIAGASGMSMRILRLATLYGEGDAGNVARLLATIDRGRFMRLGSGSNRKSLLHREDAARACLAVMRDRGRGIEVFNVSAPPCTMREVVDGLAEALGKRPSRLAVPSSWLRVAAFLLSKGPLGRERGLAAMTEKWLADDAYDAGAFARRFGFRTSVGLSEGLRREADAYRADKEGRVVSK